MVGVCRQAEEGRRAYHQPTHRNDRPGFRLPRHVYEKRGVQIGSGRKSSVFANESDRCYRGERTAEARSAVTLGPPGGQDQVAIRVPATTPRAVLKNGSIRDTAPKRTVGTPWKSNSVTTTETLAYEFFCRGLTTVRSTSSGTIRTSCFNCELVWLEQLDRFCGMRENSRPWVESSLCSRLVSAARTKLNDCVPN